jgi:hypothetical protein
MPGLLGSCLVKDKLLGQRSNKLKNSFDKPCNFGISCDGGGMCVKKKGAKAIQAIKETTSPKTAAKRDVDELSIVELAEIKLRIARNMERSFSLLGQRMIDNIMKDAKQSIDSTRAENKRR